MTLAACPSERGVAARMFERLLEAKEVKTGSGARNDRDGTSVTVSQVAEEAGVSPRTASRRIGLARDLEPYPEIAEDLDAA